MELINTLRHKQTGETLMEVFRNPDGSAHIVRHSAMYKRVRAGEWDCPETPEHFVRVNPRLTNKIWDL